MAGRVVVITGASGGIGAAVAERQATAGDRVVLVARNETRLKEVAARCGPSAVVHVADMTERIEVRRAVAAAVSRCGRIDVWVNNVGQGITRPPSELTDDDIETMMRVNVLSALYGMQEVLPHFRDRGVGHLVTISSVAGRIPYVVNRAAYTAAKHALNALTADFRSEIASDLPGVTVSLVSPGLVYTAFGKNAVHGGPLSENSPNGQTPDQVAAVVERVIETRAIDVYTRPESHAKVVAYYTALGRETP